MSDKEQSGFSAKLSDVELKQLVDEAVKASIDERADPAAGAAGAMGIAADINNYLLDRLDVYVNMIAIRNKNGELNLHLDTGFRLKPKMN